MGKRSNLERKPRDFYPTPIEAVYPLLGHVQGTFIEPCAGDGRLVRHLEKYGMRCTYASDIEPMAPKIEKRDVLFFGDKLPDAQQIITNPPWAREMLHPMIDIFRRHAMTWLLFDADWMHINAAKPFLRYCSKIVSIGRVSWEGNGISGMDNCCWYQFQKHEAQTIFLPNVAPALSSEDVRT